VSDTTETTSVKAGYKTTEFWLSVAAMIVGALFASGIFPVESTGEKILGLAATVLTALGYQVSRTLAKRG
jgi:fumarate reductase subunit D